MNKRKMLDFSSKSLNSHDGSKCTHFEGERQIIFKSFLERPKTMFECARETNIERPNVCWICGDMINEGQMQLIYKGPCPISGFRAGFYSTDTKLFSAVQLNLFGEGGIK